MVLGGTPTEGCVEVRVTDGDTAGKGIPGGEYSSSKGGWGVA